MSDAVLAAIFGPLTILLAGFILTEVVKPWLQRRRGETPSTVPAPVVGEPVPAAADGWQAAHQSVADQLADERAEHEACHAVMRKHGLPIPGDHRAA